MKVWIKILAGGLLSLVCTLNAFGGVVINVALGNRGTYSMAGAASNNADQSSTPGTAAPLTYLGSTWNQPLVSTPTPSISGLLDSQGNATSVGFSVTGYKDSVGDHGGSEILNLLGAGVHADGPSTNGGYEPENNTLPTLTINGLNDTWEYTLAIVSGGNYNNTNEWNIGGTATFSDPTTPSGFTGGTTLTTASDTSQRSTWVQGVNYVLFTNLKSVGGVITVRDRAVVDKFSLNGFQLEFTSTAVPEPATWVMGLGGLGYLIRRSAKRK